jgi:hypothetical protein
MAEFMKQAKQNIRNNKASYFVGITVSACTALVLFVRSCGGPTIGGSEGPMLAVRGDGICHEVESYPYQRDRDTGAVLCQRGQDTPTPNATVDPTTHAVTCPQGSSPVVNEHYAPEDCFYGNNVCDSQADPAQVRDPAGNPVRWDPALLVRVSTDAGTQTAAIRYHSGRTVPFPLEGDSALDCMLERVRQQPCAAFTPGSTPLQRPRFTFPPGTVDQRTRQRTQEEIVAMHAHPESLRTGGNYFTLYVGYDESCDRNLVICTPESTVPCWCPNIQECAPPPPPPPRTCGNGRADPGEQCDFRDRRRARGGCDQGNHCTRSCTCERDAPGQTCGNNRREGSEECDGTDSAACGAGTHCTSQCQCEDNVDGGGGPIGQCRPEVSRPIVSAISSQINRDPPTTRNAAGAQGGQAVTVSYSTQVDPPGVIQAPSVRLSCSGCTGGSFTVDMSRVVVSVTQSCTVGGSFSLAGEQ